MRTYMKITILLIVFITFLILASVIYAQDYYSFPGDVIHSVSRDYNNGQLIITAAGSVIIIDAGNGQIVQQFQLPNRSWIAEVGNPDYEMIYGIYAESDWTSGLYCINRTSGQIITTTLQEYHDENAVLQDETRIYVVSDNDSSGISPEDSGIVFVYSKTDLSLIEQWPCIDNPNNGTYNETDNLIYTSTWHSRVPYSIDVDPWSGDDYYRIGCYEPDRGGECIGIYEVDGFIAGMVVTGDGRVVAGLEGSIMWESPTLAVLDDPLVEVFITDTELYSLDIDIATNRLFGAVRDYTTGESRLNGRILMWDYDTGEYEFMDTGVEGLRHVTYCDEKLYGITEKDNKLYHIDID